MVLILVLNLAGCGMLSGPKDAASEAIEVLRSGSYSDLERIWDVEAEALNFYIGEFGLGSLEISEDASKDYFVKQLHAYTSNLKYKITGVETKNRNSVVTVDIINADVDTVMIDTFVNWINNWFTADMMKQIFEGDEDILFYMMDKLSDEVVNAFNNASATENYSVKLQFYKDDKEWVLENNYYTLLQVIGSDLEFSHLNDNNRVKKAMEDAITRIVEELLDEGWDIPYDDWDTPYDDWDTPYDWGIPDDNDDFKPTIDVGEIVNGDYRTGTTEQNPAKIGEFVKVYAENYRTDEISPIYVRVNRIIKGDEAIQLYKDFCDAYILDVEYTDPEVGREYIVYDLTLDYSEWDLSYYEYGWDPSFIDIKLHTVGQSTQHNESIWLITSPYNINYTKGEGRPRIDNNSKVLSHYYILDTHLLDIIDPVLTIGRDYYNGIVEYVEFR